MERIFALLAVSAVDDEAWRAAVAGETMLWRAIRDAPAAPVPPGWDALHRRGAELLALLATAGDGPRTAIDRRDTVLFADAMALLDEAEKRARSAFAAALALADDPEGGG